MSKITGNIVGLPNPLSKVKAEIEKPKEVIKLANDMRIEAREDGIYLVTEFEGQVWKSKIFDQMDGSTYSGYSDEAEYAYYAECDANGRELKGTDVIELDYREFGGAFEITDGTVLSFGLIDVPFEAVLGFDSPDPSLGFTSVLYFATPSEIPENYTQFPADIYFKGDSTDEGAFVPEPNMRYTIVFDFDGYMLNGYVSGVTTV